VPSNAKVSTRERSSLSTISLRTRATSRLIGSGASSSADIASISSRMFRMYKEAWVGGWREGGRESRR